MKIDYCCHGNQSVTDACARAGVSVNELLTAIGGDRTIEEDGKWRSEPLGALTKYIVDTHHVFTRDIIETIRLLANKVATRHGGNHPEVIAVNAFAQALCDELIPHMFKEENILFPYIESMENGENRASCFGTVANPIRMMMLEHENAGELLTKLRSTTNDYTLPPDACLSFRALYERLVDLEQDLHVHIHLENNLLFPRALTLEEIPNE
ncbi:MAG TPA: iron-sulfur cluster repair di-iron protein, partial [Thermoanaerobaculia bacterium]